MKATIDPLTGLPTFSSDEPTIVSYSQGSAGGVRSIVAGTNVTVNNADPMNPIVSATGGSSSAGGSDSQVQFNDGGAFGGDAGLTYNKTTDTLSLGAAKLPAIAAPSYAAGTLYFDTTEDALSFYSNDANVTLNIGQEQYIRALNSTGSSIANGVPVYISGATTSTPNITLSINTTSAGSQAVGLTTETIANGAMGYVAIQGKVRGVDTSAFAVGATLYVGSTAGSLTSTIPVNPAFITRVGTVLVSNATTGVVLVNVERASLFTATAAGTDLGTVLANIGARASGTTYSITTSGNITFSGAVAAGSAGMRSSTSSRTAIATLVAGSSWNNLCDATTASFTLTLPAASASSGQMLWFKKIDSTVNTITIQRAGTDTIDGATTYVLSTQYKYVEIVNNGSNAWFIKSNN